MLPKNKHLPKKGGGLGNKKPGNGPNKPGNNPKGNGPKHNPKGGHGKPGHGKGKPGKGKGGPPKGAFFGGVGGYKGVKKANVSRLVNGLMREEMNGLNKQARGIKVDAAQGVNRARTDYNRGVGDLNYVHGETGDYLSSLAQRSQQNTQGAQQQAQVAQQALQGMLGDTYSGAQAGANQELARLGIQGGGSFEQLNADSANAQAVAQQSGANNQSTLGMVGQNTGAAMEMLQGMNQGSMMQGLGQNLNARNDALSEVSNNRINQLNEVRTAMQEANATRKDLFFQLLQQLQQTGWDQYVQKRELGQSARSLNMQQQSNNRDFRLRKRALKKSK